MERSFEMTTDDIIRMAREAGFSFNSLGGTYTSGKLNDYLMRFAALVAAAEREACARMVEAFHQHGYDFTGDLELHDAIRARGQI